MLLRTIRGMIYEMVRSKDKELSEHGSSLLGPRRRGSTTEGALECFDGELEFTEFFSDAVSKGCRCFVKYIAAARGRLKAITLRTALDEGMEVHTREGAHGPELFVDVPPEECKGLSCNSIYVILGDHEGEEVVYTWHPGPPLKTYDKWTLTADTAVKLHNGE